MTPNVRRAVAIPLAVILALTAGSALAGCSAVQGLVKSATGGKVDVGGHSLPGDFPTSVPVFKGKIDSAIGLGSGSKEIWNVAVEVPGKDATDTIKSELTTAGFTVAESGSAGSDAGTVIANNKAYGVLVVTSNNASKGYWVANYTVTTATASSSSPTP